jgi:hypothetical protein
MNETLLPDESWYGEQDVRHDDHFDSEIDVGVDIFLVSTFEKPVKSTLTMHRQ